MTQKAQLFYLGTQKRETFSDRKGMQAEYFLILSPSGGVQMT